MSGQRTHDPSSRSFPNDGGPIAMCSQYQSSIWRKRSGFEIMSKGRPRPILESTHFPSCQQSPKPSASVIAAGEDKAAVTRECNRMNCKRVAREALKLPAGGKIPDQCCMIAAAGYGQPTVRRRRHGVNTLRMSKLYSELHVGGSL